MKKDTADVTACIIFRNAERTLPKCLNSIKDQVDAIIALNDYSVDFGADILSEFNVPVAINFDNQLTVSSLRHEIGSMCLTKYLFHQDADDYRFANTVKTHVETMDDKGLDVLITPFIYNNNIRPLTEDVLEDIIQGNLLTSALYFDKNKFLELDVVPHYAWEYHIIYQAYRLGYEIGFSKTPSAVYTKPGIISTRNRFQQLQSRLKLLRLIVEESKLTREQFNSIHQAIRTYEQNIETFL